MNKRDKGSDPLSPFIFGATLFFSAFLLFVCQPMVGKMLLPYLGGAAAVWTTCVLFFQVMLLAGYVYAHWISRIHDVRKQILIHSVILLLPLSFLPIRFNVGSAELFSLHPSVQLLLLLAASTAAPFFVVSTSAPLLQNWLSRSAHKRAADPYFLYSASNAGSLLALIAYPFLIEPRIGVAAQSRLWLFGYLGLALMILASASFSWARPSSSLKDRHAETAAGQGVQLRSRLFWLSASFVPSGLMLAITNHIAANVGSIPFLWLLPLGIYLVTFIFAFAHRFRISSARISRLIPVVLLGVFPLAAAGVGPPPGLNWIVIGAHLLLLYAGALLCHTKLAESRPDPAHLTEFYFWIALGGVLGGMFTAILAPLVFKTVLEYSLLVAALPFFRWKNTDTPDLAAPLILAALLGLLWIVLRATHLDSSTETVALIHTIFLFVGYKLKDNAPRFAGLFAVLILAYALILPGYIEGAARLYTTRNFFGVKKVLEDREAGLRKLLHGDTIHGMESTDAARSGQPLSYYYPGGSISDVVAMLRARGKPQRFGVVGLGAGTMAAYADPAHHVRFYEIDPAVEPLAGTFFTFVPRCGVNCDIVIGDGRMQLMKEPDGAFDLLLLDAFSSDSIPTHLVSREAVRLYLSKLTPDGVVVFNVSNRYLDVEKLVAALVSDAGLVAYSRFDDAGDLKKLGKSSAHHLVAARRIEDLQPISKRPGWMRVSRPPDFQPWTDDYSNLLGLIRWH